jgi:hypothetical protein
VPIHAGDHIGVRFNICSWRPRRRP